MPKVKPNELADGEDAETSTTVRARVEAARARQTERYRGLGIKANSELGSREVRTLLVMKDEAKQLLRHASERYRLSARAYFRTIKVAQTIADLIGTEEIETAYLAEALQYRQQEQA